MERPVSRSLYSNRQGDIVSEYVIDIGVEVEDGYINNDVEWTAKIVNAAHKYKTVVIKIYEPVAIEQLNYKGKKFLEILKDVCTENNWPKQKFRFETQNLMQDLEVWPGTTVPYNNSVFLVGQTQPVKDLSKEFTKTFGMLVNRSTWDRLLIASNLYNEHKDISFQKYCNSLENPMHMINFDFDRMLWQSSSAGILNQTLLKQIANFMSNLPMGQHVYEILKGDESKIVEHATGESVTSLYKNFFIDIVSEKMITGKVLYFTEKSARPLMTMNPFITNASVGHLDGLRKLGFKTFSKYWSEDYDYQSGVPRINSIKQLCAKLSKLTNKEIEQMYTDMKPILEHNRLHYYTLSVDKIQNTFII